MNRIDKIVAELEKISDKGSYLLKINIKDGKITRVKTKDLKEK